MSTTERQRVLVTGGSGYIGSRLCDHLASLGFAVSRLTRHEPESATENVTEVVADLRDQNLWSDYASEVEIIVHLAAQTSTYVADNDPLADREVNVTPFLRLLEACRRLEQKPFIVLASTVTVVGMTDDAAVNEQAPCAPLTVYDAHKLMAEQYLETYCRLGHARGTTLRLANVYGPGRARSSKDRGILNSMVKRALSGSTLTVYGSGESLRDYVYIDDVVRAFEAAISHQVETNGRHWIIASGKSHSIREAFELVSGQAAEHTGIRVGVESVEPDYELSPIESRNFVGDISAFSSATGWVPAFTLPKGIEATIRSFEYKAVVAL